MDNKPARRTSTQMFPLIREWQQSGQSKTKFCTNQELNIHTFNYWLNKMQSTEKPDSANGFIALKVKEPLQKIEETALQILYPNGSKISFPFGTPISYVKDLLKIAL